MNPLEAYFEQIEEKVPEMVCVEEEEEEEEEEENQPTLFQYSKNFGILFMSEPLKKPFSCISHHLQKPIKTQQKILSRHLSI